MAEPYLGPESVEDLGRMLMALLTEHWILRDRFALLEALMIERGALAEGELEDYVPGPAMAERIQALRARTVSAVIGAPLAARDRSVEAIIARAAQRGTK
jgi:hypothetical protein